MKTILTLLLLLSCNQNATLFQKKIDQSLELETDSLQPRVTNFSISLDRKPEKNPTNSSVLYFDIFFTEPVKGVDASQFEILQTSNFDYEIDFVKAKTNENKSYTIGIKNIAGAGQFTLAIVSGHSITDLSDNRLKSAVKSESWGIDQSIPRALDIGSNIDQRAYFMYFNEKIYNLKKEDFKFEIVNGPVSAEIASIELLETSDIGLFTYKIHLQNVRGSGDLRLNFDSPNHQVQDYSGNLLGIDFLEGSTLPL